MLKNGKENTPNPYDLDRNNERLVREALEERYEKLDHWNIAGLVEVSMSLDEASNRFAYLKSVIPKSESFGCNRCLVSGMSVGSEMIIAFREGFQQVHGVEVDIFYADLCKSRFEGFPALFPILYNGEDLPYSDHSFELVLSAHVIEHVENPLQYLVEHLRVLRVGGHLFLEFPNRYHLKELHTGLFSFEWLPRILRTRLLGLLGAKYFPIHRSIKSRIRAILDTDLKQISTNGIKRWLSSSGYTARIIHSYTALPGVKRCVIQKQE
jgi:SAM-dependent methyltransferase